MELTRTGVANCPQVWSQCRHKRVETEPDGRIVREWTADCPWVMKQFARKSPRTKIHLICCQIKPTTTKLGTHDHKAIGELSLRGHRSIWSQSTGNQRGMKNTQKLGHELDSLRSMNSWGIGWNPLVESLNSHPSSSQHKRNKSKRSQNNKSSQTRKGEEEEHEE
jgi:hypothetical protein